MRGDREARAVLLAGQLDRAAERPVGASAAAFNAHRALDRREPVGGRRIGLRTLPDQRQCVAWVGLEHHCLLLVPAGLVERRDRAEANHRQGRGGEPPARRGALGGELQGVVLGRVAATNDRDLEVDELAAVGRVVDPDALAFEEAVAQPRGAVAAGDAAPTQAGRISGLRFGSRSAVARPLAVTDLLQHHRHTAH